MEKETSEKLNSARALSQQGLHERALEVCNEAIKECPNSVECYEIRSSVFRRMNDLSSAILDIDCIILIAPNEAAPHFRKGRYLMKQSLYGNAIFEFSRALSLDDGYFGDAILFYRAEALLRVGEFEKALEDCKSMKSNYSENYFFGYSKRNRDEIENEALSELKRAGSHR